MADDLTLTQPDLISRLLNNLPAGYTKKKVKVPNPKGFSTPENDKYLRVSVVTFDTDSDAATGDFTITRGLFVVDVFFPKDSGDKAQLADVQIIRDLYRNQTFGNTQCQTASINTIGEDGSWYVVQVNISFYMAGF